MADKLDFKKREKDLYGAGREPALLHVPPMVFFAVDGAGEPLGEEYQSALTALYAMTFTVKMCKMGPWQPEGYQDYALPPLEGFWHSPGGALDWGGDKSQWLWTSAIRQPEFVTEEVYRWALEECRRKKPEVDVSRLRRWEFEEGLCVQVLHVGPYSAEKASMDKLGRYIGENGLRDCAGSQQRHHELYLGDPRKSAPEKLKTILRTPVERV